MDNEGLKRKLKVIYGGYICTSMNQIFLKLYLTFQSDIHHFYCTMTKNHSFIVIICDGCFYVYT